MTKGSTLIASLILLLIFSTTASSAETQKRVALVIGNGNSESSPLKNPQNDAIDMAKVLKSLGFKVILETDASKRKMYKAIDKFGKELRQG